MAAIACGWIGLCMQQLNVLSLPAAWSDSDAPLWGGLAWLTWLLMLIGLSGAGFSSRFARLGPLRCWIWCVTGLFLSATFPFPLTAYGAGGPAHSAGLPLATDLLGSMVPLAAGWWVLEAVRFQRARHMVLNSSYTAETLPWRDLCCWGLLVWAVPTVPVLLATIAMHLANGGQAKTAVATFAVAVLGLVFLVTCWLYLRHGSRHRTGAGILAREVDRSRHVGPAAKMDLANDIETILNRRLVSLCRAGGGPGARLMLVGTESSEPWIAAFSLGPLKGWIWLSRSVMRHCSTAETMALTAHELGHIQAWHPVRRAVVMSALVALLGILLPTQAPVAGVLGIAAWLFCWLTAVAAAAFAFRRYAWWGEHEADVLGSGLMGALEPCGAGALDRALRRLAGSRRSDWLHPPLGDRLKWLQRARDDRQVLGLVRDRLRRVELNLLALLLAAYVLAG